MRKIKVSLTKLTKVNDSIVHKDCIIYDGSVNYEKDPTVQLFRDYNITGYAYHRNMIAVSDGKEIYRLEHNNTNSITARTYFKQIFKYLDIEYSSDIEYWPGMLVDDLDYLRRNVICEYYDIDELYHDDLSYIVYKIADIENFIQYVNSAKKEYLNKYPDPYRVMSIDPVYLDDVKLINQQFRKNVINPELDKLRRVLEDNHYKKFFNSKYQFRHKDSIFTGEYKLDKFKYTDTENNDKLVFDKVTLSFNVISDRAKVKEYIKNHNVREEIVRPFFNHMMGEYAGFMKMYEAVITRDCKLVFSFCFKEKAEKLLSGESD